MTHPELPSKSELTIVLTRHGQTTRSDPEQYLGQRIEAPLTKAGRDAARKLGRRLDGVRFARVLSSPLRRAVETARLIAPEATIEEDDRLKEMDYGDWEGLLIEQIEERYGEVRRRWEDDPAATVIPGGESGERVAARVRSFLDEIITWDRATGSEDPVLVVAHSTLNRIFLAVALQLRLADYRRRFRQDWANLTVLRFPGTIDDGAQLLVSNDISHLKGIQGATWT